MKITLVFHKFDRNNGVEFLKTSFTGIVAQWNMGLRKDNENKILHGKNPKPNETQEQS